MKRPLEDALTDAIVRVAQKDSALFSHIHVAALVVRLEPGHEDRLLSDARELAQTLAKDVSDAGLGRGRVTDRRLDQRLKR